MWVGLTKKQSSQHMQWKEALGVSGGGTKSGEEHPLFYDAVQDISTCAVNQLGTNCKLGTWK
jgi:hypothetical protein